MDTKRIMTFYICITLLLSTLILIPGETKSAVDTINSDIALDGYLVSTRYTKQDIIGIPHNHR